MKLYYSLSTLLFIYFFKIGSVNLQLIRPCPPLTPLGNLSDPNDLQQILSGILLNVWQIPKPTLTTKASELKRVLLSMLGSDNPTWQNTAIGASFWIWTVIPQIQKNPNLCIYAAIANANAKWLSSKNCEDLRPVLLRVPNLFFAAANLVADTARENSECGKATYKPARECCPDDGKKINFDALFDQIRDIYPPEFEQVMRKVCKSSKYLDQIMCVTVAASTSAEFGQAVAEFSNEIRLTFFNMLISPPLPKKCCSAFRRKLTDLLALVEAESQRATAVTLANIGC